MTHTNQTVDSIGTGIRFQFAADGDSYYVAAGVTVRSTDDLGAIVGVQAGVSVHVDGRVESLSAAGIILLGAENEVTIGKQGAVSTTGALPAVAIFGESGALTNLGRIIAETGIGAVAIGEANQIVNKGLVNAASAVVLETVTDNSFENFGRVRANSFDDANQDYSFNNGVFSRGANSLIFNHEKGTISAISSEGAGVAVANLGNGSEVVNDGKISSELWYGVDFFNLDAASSAHLENSGRISGGTGSFRGNETADFVVNTGRMKGDLIFDAGDDVLDGARGKIIGDVSGGDGNDVLCSGKGNQTVDGGAGDDIIDGGKGKDQLRGDVGADTFVFSNGYRKDEISDFISGTDLIDVSGWKAIDDFDDLLSHARNRSGDVWIVAGKDTLIIDNVSKGDLQDTDFQF